MNIHRELVRHENLRPYLSTVLLRMRVEAARTAKANRQRYAANPYVHEETEGLCIAMSVATFTRLAIAKETARTLNLARHFA